MWQLSWQGSAWWDLALRGMWLAGLVSLVLFIILVCIILAEGDADEAGGCLLWIAVLAWFIIARSVVDLISVGLGLSAPAGPDPYDPNNYLTAGMVLGVIELVFAALIIAVVIYAKRLSSKL